MEFGEFKLIVKGLKAVYSKDNFLANDEAIKIWYTMLKDIPYYIDGPFTLYEGANELDFRVNALGEILYGQDPTSPTFVSSTFYNMMKDNNDPRLYRICRHYINTKRSETKPDAEWNVDVTDEVLAYYEKIGESVQPCNPGAAWYSDWVNAPADSEIPTLEKLVAQDPTAGFNGNNFNARMLRPFLSIDFEMPNRPGFLMSSAEQ